MEAKNAALVTLVGDMGGRHEQLTGAIRYFEDQYVQDPSKDKIELLTKEYLANALNTVATDVNVIANNLNEFLDLQAEAVDSLGTSLEMANMRLRMLKQQVNTAPQCQATRPFPLPSLRAP